MRLTPTYGFDDLTSTGIDKVPDYSHVMIENDGNGQTRLYMKIDGTGLVNTSTIQDFLNNEALYCVYEPIRKNTDPVASDDITKNYKLGQIIVNEVTGDSFILTDNTAGSAVWEAVGGSKFVYNKTQFTAAGGELTYALQYTPGYIDVYNDGVKLIDGSDYTAVDGSFVNFNSALTAGSKLTFQAWNIADVVAFVAQGTDVTINTSGFTNNLSAADTNVQLALDTLDDMICGSSISYEEFTATPAQDTFNITGGYTVSNIEVFVEGMRLQGSEYTAANSTSVVLDTACSGGEGVSVKKW